PSGRIYFISFRSYSEAIFIMQSFAAPGAKGALRRRLLLVVLLAVGSAAVVGPLVMARPLRKNEEHSIAVIVTALMDQKHVAQKQVDDETSRRAMKMFFETLDPMKLYFYQSDVDQFASEN